MPFLTEEEQNVSIVEAPNVLSPLKNPPKPTSWQIAAASARQTNTIVSSGAFLNRGSLIGPREDFTYDSVTPLMKTKYEPYIEEFYDADSDEEVESIKNRIDAEEEDRKIIAEGGGESVAWMLAAGVLDPVNFIPVAGWLAKGAVGVKAARGFAATSKALAATAASGAAVGAVTTAASEAVLQQTQEIRPIEESLTNIGVGAVLTGVLGAGAAGLSKTLRGKVLKDLTIDDTFAGNAKYSEEQALEGQSLSSAFVGKKATLEDNEIAGVSANAAAKAFKKLNPQFNLAQSDSLVVREIGQQLQEGAFVLKKNLEGIESPIAAETRIKLYDNLVGQSKETLQSNFNNYKKRVSKLSPNDAEAPLDIKNFKDQVSLALTSGDVHSIPEVQAAAKAYRVKLYDTVLKEGQTPGIEIFPEKINLRNAQSYFPQMYDQSKLIADRSGFKQKILEYLPGALESELKQMEVQQALVSKIRRNISRLRPGSKKLLANNKKLAEAEKILDNYRILESRLEEGDYSDIADEIIGHIQGQKEGIIFNQRIPLTKGPMKEKKLDFVPQVELRAWSITDAEEVASKYTKNVAPEIELRRIFGDIELKDQIKAINDDYNNLINKAKTPEKVNKLEKARKNDIKDIEALAGRLRGTYGRPIDADQAIYTALQGVRTLNYVTKLGGVTVSSIPDLGRIVAIKGLSPVLTQALIPMITNFKKFKVSAREARLAGAAWDIALGNSRATSMAELINPIISGNRTRKTLDTITDKFSRATLAPYFEAARKNFSSVLIQRKNFEDIDLLIQGKLDTAGIADLAKNGIGEYQAKAINKMWQEFGEIDGEIYIANTEKWTDKSAVLSYRAALNKQITQFSTMVGAGDKPRWMSTELGKTLGQFESFNLAATSKILISNLQTADMKTLNALTVSVGLGMLVYAYREIANGHEPSNKPADWIAKGVDNSGLLGVLASANNRISNLTGNALNASRLIGASNEEYRIDTKSKVADLLGPTGQYGSDLLTIFTLFNDKNKWSKRDTRAIRRLIPFQNLVILRKLFDKAEEGINQSLGVKTK